MGLPVWVVPRWVLGVSAPAQEAEALDAREGQDHRPDLLALSLRVQVARMRWSPSQRELAQERVAHPAAVVDVAGAADEGDSSSASAVESTSGR